MSPAGSCAAGWSAAAVRLLIEAGRDRSAVENDMDELRQDLQAVLGAARAADYSQEDLNALIKHGYTGRRWLETATREGLERSGLQDAKIDALLSTFAGSQPKRQKPQFVGFGNSEAKRNPSVPRSATAKDIACYVYQKGFSLLRASPRAGKTALLLELWELARTDQDLREWFGGAYYMDASTWASMGSWEDAFKQETKEPWSNYKEISGGGGDTEVDSDPKPILLLVDELQTLYHRKNEFATLWAAIKGAIGTRVRILAAAVCGHCTTPGSPEPLQQLVVTPFEMTPEAMISLKPTAACPMSIGLRTEERDELWRLQLKHWACTWQIPETYVKNMFTATAPSTLEDLYFITAGQVGVFTALLDIMGDSLRNELRRAGGAGIYEGLGDRIYRHMMRSSEVFIVLHSNRAFMYLTLDQTDTARISFFRALLASPDGRVKTSALDPQEKRVAEALYARGCIQRHFISSGLDAQTEMYSLYTPLHLRYCENLLYYHTIDRPASNAQIPDFSVFLEMCLTRMLAGTTLSDTLSQGTDGRVLERKWQLVFYQAALSLLPRGVEVAPDVGAASESRGFVDFWISGPNFNWAVELLRDGVDLAKHAARFQPGGKYSMMPYDHHAVLDFRRGRHIAPLKSFEGVDTMHIVFSQDCKSAVLHVPGSSCKTFYAPPSVQQA